MTRQSLTNTAFAGIIENGTVLDLRGRTQKDVSLQEASLGKSLSLFCPWEWVAGAAHTLAVSEGALITH